MGLYNPKSILVIEQDCKVETSLEVLELKAKNLAVDGGLVKTKWNMQIEGDLIMNADEALISAGGHIKIKGLLKAGRVKAGQFIEAESIEAAEIESGRGYNIITNSLIGNPKIRGRVEKKDP